MACASRAPSASAAPTSTIPPWTSPSCASGWAWCSRSRTRFRSRSSRTSPTARGSSACRTAATCRPSSSAACGRPRCGTRCTLVQAVVHLVPQRGRLHESALGLSGGQQQRLCIARAIAVEPDVLLMDEPCSALDPIATAKIEELMLELKNSYTIVIVTHNMQQAARVSDYTGFMLLGELGVTRALFTNPRDKRTEDYITGRFG